MAVVDRGGSPAAIATRTSGDRALGVLVFVVGMCSLGAEIAAARLLAPYFGASTIVWANTIGVVLVALSIGYWLGGRLADRRPDETGLRRLVLVAAAGLAAIPLLSGPFFRVALSAFDAIDAGAFVGSLVGILALVAVPVVLLGAASPWALRLAVRRVEESGRVAGRLYALSTAGSLTGTFLSALVLVPFVGTQRTFIVFAALLALVAALGLPRRLLLVPLGLLALLALPPGITKPGDDGESVVAERETPYQYARVVQDGSRRLLELNEGKAVHSIYDRRTVLTDGVWDGYLVLPFARLGRAPTSLAMLGNAAGTTARAYERYFPQTRIDGVEIDPELSELGRRHFEMDNPRLTVHHEDARPFLRRAERRYEAITVDAYRQPYLPFYLTTREFFRLARSRLAPGGVLIINVGHPEGSDDLERVLSATLRAEFPHVVRWPIEAESTLLAAAADELTAERLRAGGVRTGAPELESLAADGARALAPAPRGGRVYTDDRAPVEWLIDSSIVSFAAREG